MCEARLLPQLVCSLLRHSLLVELRASCCGLNLSDPKNAQALRDPGLLVGSCTRRICGSQVFICNFSTTLSPQHNFSTLERLVGFLLASVWRLCRKAAICKPEPGLSPRTSRTCTRWPHFCLLVHKGHSFSAFLFEITIRPVGAIAMNLNFIHLWDK